MTGTHPHGIPVQSAFGAGAEGCFENVQIALRGYSSHEHGETIGDVFVRVQSAGVDFYGDLFR